MSRKWKRNAIVAATLVLVGTAAAVNWKYTPQNEDSEAAQETGTKILGEATLVNGEASDGVEGALQEETVYDGESYFASARLTRQQARDSALALLQEAAEQPDADEEAATRASEEIQAMAACTVTESQVENLVTAKGYSDCIAFLNDDSISVVVGTANGELTGEDVAKIADIAITETGLPAAAIKIMAAN